MSLEYDPSQRAAFLKQEVDAELGSSSRSQQVLNQNLLALTRKLPSLWVISTITFACATALPLLREVTGAGILPSGSRRVEVQFTGALTWNSSGVLVNEHKPGERIWVGEPSPEIDAAWDSLKEVWVVMLEGEEASKVRDKTTLQDGYWLSGLDVFHQLHCLDSLRRAIYPEHYPPQALPRTWRLHMDHCIDYLRQVLMCHGDTTPVNQKWFDAARRYGPDFETLHTCRPFDELVAWSRARSPEARSGTEGREVAKDANMVVREGLLVAHERRH
ncbi:hypothetical protein F4808DRAFT_458939 [Astrocystis sublimbata]|nr:hypothetical protein F4808DRAFT_458939 [Astrocystis sublimbata]